MSSTFTSGADNLLPWLSTVVFRCEGKTCQGQNYLIVITNAVWYKVRLFLEEDHLRNGNTVKVYHYTEHLTLQGAKDKVTWIENQLQRNPILEMDTYFAQNCLDFYCSIINFPDDCKTNPEKYLNRGDHVQITRKGGLYHHDAVYMGNGKVIHMYMKEGESKADAKAQEDDWSVFVGFDADGNVPWLGTVSVIVYKLRTKTVEEITSTAEDLVRQDFRSGQYNLLTRNCQHFATYCCTGQEFCLDRIFFKNEKDSGSMFPLEYDP